MNTFLKILVSLLLLISAGIFVILFLTLEDSPMIAGKGPVSSAEFQETLSFLEKSDPRDLRPGSVTSLTIRAEDADLFLNYMLDVSRSGAAEVSISEGQISALASVRMPSYLLGLYVNLQMALSSSNESLVIEKLRMGRVEFPLWLANATMKYAHYQLREREPEYAEVLNAIDSYRIVRNEVVITYRWDPQLVDLLSSRGRDLLIEDDDKERLGIHALKLAEIVGDPSIPNTLPLVDLLRPMFAFAKSRNGDPVEENRAAIVTMAFYVMDVGMEELLGGRSAPNAPKRHRITLSGRQDFAKHFITSAAITVSASTSVADSFGMLKEIDDTSAGGSGFSFTDVGADRSGVRFAELAVSNSQNAAVLQEKLSGNMSEDLFIPDLADLPEFMSEDEFSERYGDVDQPEFQNVIKDIEERISQLPIFNSL